MKDTDWEILYRLYETPNMTKVADMLYISQPSLTKRVKSMEKDFGVKIINRTSKGVKFTPEGEYLAKRAKEYMEFIKDVKHGLYTYKTELEGTIKIGSPYTYSKFELTDVLYRYSQEHKNIKFEIINDQSNNLFRMILENHIELGFVCGDFEGGVGTPGQSDPPIGFCASSKLRKNEDNGWVLAPVNLYPTTGIPAINTLYVVEGCEHPAAAKLLIRFMMGGIDGDTSGYEPFNTLGGWPVRDDIEPAEGSVPYEEMNVSPFDPNSIYTEFMTVRDFWQMLG